MEVDVLDTEVSAQGQNSSLGKLINQGAEARLYECIFMGRKAIVKERFSKKYRHPILDSKITQKRLCGEARSVAKARRLGVATPALFAVDSVLHTITFEFIDGMSIKDILLTSDPLPSSDSRLEGIATKIGIAIARLHDGGLIHGDLTTSNMMIHEETQNLVMIDFGLSFTSSLAEDKAVDLYVLERALLSLHSSLGDVVPLLADGAYSSSLQEIIKALEFNNEQIGASSNAGKEACDDRVAQWTEPVLKHRYQFLESHRCMMLYQSL